MSSTPENPDILFQPIVDTGEYRIRGHFCDARNAVDVAIRAAAARSTYGLYFIKTCMTNPRCYAIREAVRESALDPSSIVFEIPEAATVREPARWRKVSAWYRQSGFGIALTGAGSTPKSVPALLGFRPDYIKLDKPLVRNIERLSCAMAIRGLADVAEEWGGAVVADGVERMLTVENLWLLNVYLMQGSLFGRPAPELTRNNSASLANLARTLMPEGAAPPPILAAGAGGASS